MPTDGATGLAAVAPFCFSAHAKCIAPFDCDAASRNGPIAFRDFAAIRAAIALNFGKRPRHRERCRHVIRHATRADTKRIFITVRGCAQRWMVFPNILTFAPVKPHL
ncbi:hypothetical protein [Burkholderia multivorans]|uniref:hypothetical protein n=1 Tax=Burkholderia multivorans TaxID=87883 RepID=UPI00209F76EC|nr:hypothetical protein [Burkholderia multivorans]MCO8589764.1 hypothetical protein [Burkholderia multivorans]MCO8609567.1 hypothetical protein [Burkholderia multivorans]MCO8631455.1 hypothetical protein [Burkholderia multivorans]MCO8636400.1 hypothetical protein [Burkholderia multivorans]